VISIGTEIYIVH